MYHVITPGPLIRHKKPHERQSTALVRRLFSVPRRCAEYRKQVQEVCDEHTFSFHLISAARSHKYLRFEQMLGVCQY